jgi:hypothetical protein
MSPWLLACSTAHSEGTAKSVLMRSDGDTRLPSPPASLAFQASFDEQIKHIIGKLHAVFVQPQQQQDESLCGMIEQQMIFARPIDQTLIVWSNDPDTILVPSGENATDVTTPLWAFVFSLSCSSLTARQANRRQFLPRRGDFEGSRRT